MAFGLDEIGQHVLGVDNADDIVAGVLIDGQARMPRVADGLGGLHNGGARGHAVDIRARGHDVLHLEFVQGEDGQQHGPFFRLQFAVGAGFENGLLQVIFVLARKQGRKFCPQTTVGFAVKRCSLRVKG